LQVDPIIQISVVSSSLLNMNIQQKSIITLGSCNPIQDTTIIQCTSEEQLIKEFESIIKTENPDIVTGYNILGFDFPYIVNRAKQKHLIIKLGRLGEICTVKETSFSSKQRGNTTSYTVETSGRIIFDMYAVISNDVSIKLR
jgi:DNA polymerase delta subunit 1